MQQQLKTEYLKNLFRAIKNGATFEEVLELAGYLCAIFNICSFIVKILKFIHRLFIPFPLPFRLIFTDLSGNFCVKSLILYFRREKVDYIF